MGTELAESGVRFVAVDPGEMNTRMHAEAVPDADVSPLAAPEEVARKIRAILEAVEGLPQGARLIAAKFQGDES